MYIYILYIFYHIILYVYIYYIGSPYITPFLLASPVNHRQVQVSPTKDKGPAKSQAETAAIIRDAGTGRD